MFININRWRNELMNQRSRQGASSLMMAFSTILLFTLLGINICSAQQPATTPDIQKADTNLIQFKAGKHIIGFTPIKAYLASVDHALSVEFMGTKGVMPKADKNPVSKKPKEAEPLGKVTYENLWPGINLTYEAAKNGITESTYIVAPGADVSKIRLKYNVSVEIQKNGSLRFKFEKGYMTESAPVAWQDIKGKRTFVKVAFKLSNGEIGFKATKYDPKYALIIDPTYEWHTFYGSDSADEARGITVDAGGNIYFTGVSYKTWGTPIHAHTGSSTANLFVMKLDGNGQYLWHTFYGSENDVGYSIAVDGNGNIYVTGYSLTSWGSPLNSHGGGRDIVVLKLDNTGTYMWHTFYGSSDHETGQSIAIDSNSNIYITGTSNSSWGAPLHNHAGGWGDDIVILKLDSNGQYKWHTFYGSENSDDVGYGIALDNNQNIYVAGYSYSVWGTPLNFANSNAVGIIILKLDNNGQYLWHTFYGGDGWNTGNGIAVDGSNNVYITGFSENGWGTPLHAHSDEYYVDNILILKLDSNGQYSWHTFLGTGWNIGKTIVTDIHNNLYVVGTSMSSWGSPLHPHSDGEHDDVAVIKLKSNGQYQWHTFYGTDSYSVKGWGIATDIYGNIYASGNSSGPWGSPLNPYSGNQDALALKISPSTCPASAIAIKMTSASRFPTFSVIQNAYDYVWWSNAEFLLQALSFNEDLVFAKNVNLTLSGGYECGFESLQGRTVLNGSMTISKGSVTVENLIIK
jgi:hypothetical protein